MAESNASYVDEDYDEMLIKQYLNEQTNILLSDKYDKEIETLMNQQQ